ncbi:sorting nexin-16 [Diorhabda sublineata]|uniref:sorting nexin-16 n=1 Tax=Diorhabda sublineata TaxID=1163346 RepID=UPI0024E0E010|nr:sorting nexin-16 [Diorhabda sublineata]XP_056635879.1 sorting nexin-16 [Diorhabda sublineata]
MCDSSTGDSSPPQHTISISKLDNDITEKTEENTTTDSEEYLSETLRYKNFQYSQSNVSNITLSLQNSRIEEENGNGDTSIPNGHIISSNIQIPIVGYEIMEERARFTVYKLKVENKLTGGFWYVFRRYTDFVRLCNRLKNRYQDIVQHLPRKRWLKNNFDPIFLEERVNGLQTLVNAILNVPELIGSQEIQDFFCLNEPPVYSETSEETKAIFEALEDTISELKQQIREKDTSIDSLEMKLHSLVTENDNLRKLISNSMMSCQKCQKECENFQKISK